MQQECTHNELTVQSKNLLNIDKLSAMLKHFILLILFATTCFIDARALANSVITVAWSTRPPHQYTENGLDKGARLLFAKEIFRKAGIFAQFIEEPSKRIWTQFETKRKNFCSFDWYRTPEREAIVQFTKPFAQTPPYSVLVSNSDFEKAKKHTHISSLLADNSLRLALVESASYGNELETQISKSKNYVTRYNTTPMVIARMVGANRASYMFIDKDDWGFLKLTDPHFRSANIVEIEGMPASQLSYIVCGKDIPIELIKKINAALSENQLNQ